MDFHEYASLYKNSLLNNIIPFWLSKSGDEKFGGYLTCLDRDGNVYDTDKFVWMQCRQVWLFSMLYNKVEKREEWLRFAEHGAVFLKNYGKDKDGNWYFSLDKEGKPLINAYNIFSDCFASMAFGQLSLAANNKEYGEIAISTFHNILRKQDNPKGKYSKSFPGTRPLQSFALPMMLCNLVSEIEPLLNRQLVESTINTGIYKILEVFYQPEFGLILENVTPEGAFLNSIEGRLINPGHSIEALWIVMNLLAREERELEIRKAVNIMLNILEYSWDKEYDGIFYFLDVKGKPLLPLEWDQKLWWVHIETIVALLKGFLYTSDQRCWEWFKKVHDYTWDHFPDPDKGEWFGYLNRQGEVLLSLKGGKWKGCFHIPRGLYQSWKILEELNSKSSKLTITH